MKKIELFPYQNRYYSDIRNALEKHSGVLLCMDTGMGKTYVATKLIQDSIESAQNVKILVLVRKKNLSDPWERLFKDNSALVDNNGSPLFFLYSKEEGKKLKSNKDSRPDFTDFKVILANYEIVETNIEDFTGLKWDLAIYDEIHDRTSKEKSQDILRKLTRLNIKKQIGLTASPMKNSMKELLFLHSFILNNKTIVDTYRKYEKWVAEYQTGTNNISQKQSKIKLTDEQLQYFTYPIKSNEVIKNIWEYDIEIKIAEIIRKEFGTTIFYYSKRDKDVPNLPPLITRNIYLPLLTAQSAEILLNVPKDKKYKLWDNQSMMVETSPAAAYSANKIILERKELGISTKEIFVKHLVKYITETTNDKIVIFSQLTRILAYFLRKLEKFGCILIEGKTKDYLEQIEKFNKTPEKRVILVSIEAYKEGIDLRCANHVIFLDLPYNPQVLLQAKDRCHRTGQKKNVFVYYLFYNSSDTFSPDRIRTNYLNFKNNIFEKYFGVDSDGNKLPDFIIENYIFEYEEENEIGQIDDMLNNYSVLKNFLNYFFKTLQFTFQYEKYNTSDKKENVLDKYGIYARYSKIEGSGENDYSQEEIIQPLKKDNSKEIILEIE